ncbi:MAG: filamentous hemagglutinin N-terminal domain-containing protein, partial [Rhizobiaceae bacterium]|nr:filamentous hemagglutinin N-terminal domain-containing protein [Rhizobiaceae bacterium]
MPPRAKKLVKRFAALLAASQLTVIPVTVVAAELPTGGNVVSGSATITQKGANQLLINQASQNAILEFDTFSIGTGGHVHFSNGSGSTLNRVTGGYQSKIDGRLTATGSLLLINPNGVIVGKDGVIETGGSFLASTRDITNADFLDGGDNTFIGDSDAAVINLGKVSSLGGDVTLIAHKVVNEGTLEAKQGTVGLASGIEILLRDNSHADGRILVKAGKSGGSVTNAGAIRAANAELRAHSGHVYALAQNRKGSIQVTGVRKSGGRVFLTANGGKVVTRQKITAKRRIVKRAAPRAKPKFNGGDVFINADIVNVSGLIDVSGETGGTIDVGAKQSIKVDNALLNASGIGDAGRIRLGGEFQGGSDLEIDEVQNTQELLVTKTVALNASSKNGDGGTVIAWSDGNTYFGADVDVSAGSGDGGLVETSGKIGLAISGDASVNALSANGQVGDWLLDPRRVRIVDGGGIPTPAQLANGNDTTSNLTVDADALNNAMANIDIIASQRVIFDEAVNIANAGVGLNVTANDRIEVNAAIQTNNGDVSFTSNRMFINAGIDVGTGTVALAQSTAGRQIDLGTEVNSRLSLTMAEIDRITADNLNIGNADSGAIRVSDALRPANVKALSLTSGGNISFNRRVNGAFDLAANTASGEVTFRRDVGSVAALKSVNVEAQTVNLDGNITTTDGITGSAKTVNVLSSNGGFEFADALDLLPAAPSTNDDAQINLAAGSYGSFVVDKQNVTVTGQGNATVINAASPAVTISANGVTINNMLLQGTGAIDDVGVLLDGTAAPNLTGASIVNVDFDDLDDGVRSQGDIGDGNAGTVDVIIRGANAGNKALFQDFLGSAIDVGDVDGDAVYVVRDVIIQDGNGNNISTNDDAIRFGSIGGASIRRVEISQTQDGEDGIDFADQTNATIQIRGSNIVARADGIDFSDLTGGRVTIANNAVIRGTENPNGDGIEFGTISGGALVNIEGNTLIRGRRNGVHVGGQVTGEATVNIVGNRTIEGNSNHGINFDGLIRGSSIAINNNRSILGLGRDGIHFDGPMLSSFVNVRNNRLIRGFQDGIDVSLINDSTLRILNNRRIRGVTQNGIEFDGDVEEALDDVLSNGARVVINRNRRINGGAQGDGIQVLGNIADNSSMIVRRNREITGGLNGLAFLGRIEDAARLTIDRNGRARQDGANYNGSDPVNSTFNVTQRVAGGTGAAILFDDTIMDRASVSIRRNMLTGGNDGIVFNAVSTARTTQVHNNFIGLGDGIGLQFLGDVASQIDVFQNYISGNTGGGIFIDPAAGIGANNIAVNQNFMPGAGFTGGNGGLVVNHQGSGTINVEGNWWGSQSSVDIMTMLANVAVPNQILATGIDSNMEVALGATRFDPFAFQGGALIEPTP